MTANRYLIADRTVLLKSKLDSLSVALQTSVSSGEFVTQEQYILEVARILGELQDTLSLPSINLEGIQPELYPDPEVYNEIWRYLLDTLIAIFQEFENIETLSIANFNFTTLDSDRLMTKIKRISSLLGDYILYCVDTSRDAIYFSDSFNNLSKVDTYTSLLNGPQCEIDQGAGVITLPLSKEQDHRVLVNSLPIINAASNGTRGNNQETGAQLNANLTDILDHNADTWFEYEKVVSLNEQIVEPLILDITLNLGEAKVINFIGITPNNFGTKTVMQIDAIDTSVDGENFISIKDEIPVPGFVVADEPNIFELAPSTSKFAGGGYYHFPPRKVRYIHIALRQNQSYIITTSSGEKQRFAIGIRDIDVMALTYQSAGELISRPFGSIAEIRKVLLRTQQVPTAQSELAAIVYSISPDNGVTWFPINSDTFNNLGYLAETTSVSDITDSVFSDELLDFNGVEPDSIKTLSLVKDLRLKVSMSRNDAIFETANSMIKREIQHVSEPITLPGTVPNQVILGSKPINDQVQVIEAGYGSCGDIGIPYTIGYQNFSAGQTEYQLPFYIGQRPNAKTEETYEFSTVNVTKVMPMDSWITLKVNGDRWLHTTVPLSSASSTDKVYSYDPNRSVISFGNGTNGAAIPDGAKVDLHFSADRLRLNRDGVAQLQFPTTLNKNVCELKVCLAETVGRAYLPRGKTQVQLPHNYISSYRDLASMMTSAGFTESDFINGELELTGDKTWSIDTEKGIIYMSRPVTFGVDFPISYNYIPTRTLGSGEWDWVADTMLATSIEIKSDTQESIQVEETVKYVKGGSGSYMCELANHSIVAGSVKLFVSPSIAESSNPFLREVRYIDGQTEFAESVTLKQQSVPALSQRLNEITLDEGVYSNVTYPVFFSQTSIFNSLQLSEIEVVATGQYYVDRAGGRVVVYCQRAYDREETGYITFPISNAVIEQQGLYSIDYANGVIYSDRILSSSLALKATYNYTHYEFSYPIVRVLDPRTYSYLPAPNAIQFSDAESFFSLSAALKRADGSSRQYAVLYDKLVETKADMKGLQPYFTPILYEYVLKVLTKGKVF